MKNLKYVHVFLIIAALGVSVKVVHAQEKPTPQIIESWECFDAFEYISWNGWPKHKKPPVVVRLKRLQKGGFEFGEVVVAGSSQKASFQIRGFNRRWDFGTEYKYAFIIRPNKSGAYFDFTTSSNSAPSQLFKCEN